MEPLTPGVVIRDVVESDLPILFAQQNDPLATAMAAFPSKEREPFMTHWRGLMNDPNVFKQTIATDGKVAGHVLCFRRAGRDLIGYWIGREYWGRGIATRALAMFLKHVPIRPLFAFVATHNVGSAKVLTKCGFRLVETIPPQKEGDVADWLFTIDE
jgi:RimJ/RimL family protein N-acetyltransferase